MPSDRTPSQAEIEAATRALNALPPDMLTETALAAKAALSAAATARPDSEPAFYEHIIDSESELAAPLDERPDWEGIARELFEVARDLMSRGGPLPGAVIVRSAKACAAFEQASLGEGEPS